ncbi:trypsin-like peptidase domain-containing protein [Ilumatobacter sp.]|uniref:trypsin-like peptidase domain-containing protein n=1 Tax=Ilumatobacter sp. TaxID=1967498 RepID=UPI003AF89405
MLVAPGLALTSAHVVAGGEEITVDQRGRESTGTIVAFDPEMDLAYVAFDGVPTAIPEVDSDHVEAGDTGVAYVVRERVVTEVPVRIRRRVNIRTEDIYIEGETLRPGFELDAEIESGDSGGAVMVDGNVVGVIWARSNKYDERAYAIDAVRAADLIDEQRATGRLGPDVDITRCH